MTNGMTNGMGHPAVLMAAAPAFSIGDIGPLTWLGDKAAELALTPWTSAMVASWSAAMWLLTLAFRLIDAFTTPDLSEQGPMRAVLPYTFALGGALAGITGLIQICVAIFRRDGKSLAQLLLGLAQFMGVWAGVVAFATAQVLGVAGLTSGLLHGLLGIDSFAEFKQPAGLPRQVTDATVATVLGVCSFLLIIGAVGFIVVMLVREVALMVITSTAVISAAGLLSAFSSSWFWKSVRWFYASLLIPPLAVLVMGLGTKSAEGVISGAGDSTAAAVGMAVVSCVLILIAAFCPLLLFRLLAFVDPGTSSGQSFRASMAAAGGVSGLLGGASAVSPSGGGQASSSSSGGGARSQGEADAEGQTQSRFAGALGGLSPAIGGFAQKMAGGAHTAAAVGADVLAMAGVGDSSPYFGATPDANRGSGRSPAPGSGNGRTHPGEDTGNDPPASPPGPPTIPGTSPGTSASAAPGPTPKPEAGPNPNPPTPQPTPPATGAAAGEAGGAAGAATAVPIVPV